MIVFQLTVWMVPFVVGAIQSQAHESGCLPLDRVLTAAFRDPDDSRIYGDRLPVDNSKVLLLTEKSPHFLVSWGSWYFVFTKAVCFCHVKSGPSLSPAPYCFDEEQV